jgi:hypothetical protein
MSPHPGNSIGLKKLDFRIGVGFAVGIGQCRQEFFCEDPSGVSLGDLGDTATVKQRFQAGES